MNALLAHLRRFTPLAMGAVLLLVPLAAAAIQPYYQSDGVSYFLALGAPGSGHLVVGDGTSGQPQYPFDGCVFAQLRPNNDHGRIRFLGLFDRDSVLDFDMSNFTDAAGRQGGLATNLTVDGRLDDGGSVTYPAVMADAAAWGHGTMTLNDYNLTNDGKDGEPFTASYFVSQQGFRDDATGAILKPDGSPWTPGAGAKLGDAEAHIRIQQEGSVQPLTFTLANDGDLPDGTAVNRAEFTQSTPFPNLRWLGQGTAHVTLTSKGAPGQTKVTFSVVASNTQEVANQTLSADLTSPNGASADLNFPLDHLGTYTLRAKGSLMLAQYSIAVTLNPPPPLDLNIWWDHVLWGRAARDGYNDCLKIVNQAGVVAGGDVGRADPPAFPLRNVIVAVSGVFVGLIVLARLVVHARSQSAFKTSHRSK